jgi:membrane-associated phospholipid phosphatase
MGMVTRMSAHPVTPVAAAATLAFCVLTADVATGAAGVGPADGAIHTWVATALTSDTRGFWQHVSSNVLVGAALISDALCCVALVGRKDSTAADARAVALALAVFTVAFGALLPLHDDGTLGVIKAAVHRPRPTALGTSFAFPSGHTAMASFAALTGAMVLVPRVLPRVFMSGPSASNARTSLVAAALAVAVATGASRVLGDVHWASDTVGGALYGGGLAMWAAVAADVMDAAYPGKGAREDGAKADK